MHYGGKARSQQTDEMELKISDPYDQLLIFRGYSLDSPLVLKSERGGNEHLGRVLPPTETSVYAYNR